MELTQKQINSLLIVQELIKKAQDELEISGIDIDSSKTLTVIDESIYTANRKLRLFMYNKANK